MRAKSVIFEITYRCNFHCKHCYLENLVSNEKNVEYWVCTLKKLVRMEYRDFILTGGEPLCYSDFNEILLYAKLLGMKTSIFSNGFYIENKIDQIKKSHVDKMCISIYGGSADVHDNITGVPGSFCQLMKSLDCLSKNSICTQLRMIVLKENYNEFERVVHISKAYGMELLLDPFLTPKLDSHNCQDELKITEEQYNLMIHQFIDMNNVKINNNKSCSGGCRAGTYLLVFDPSGNIYPCTKIRKLIGRCGDELFLFNNEITNMDIIKKRFPDECISQKLVNNSDNSHT
jgi:MoaA/NifB/PqqE/SkfB family radical SAM enzyme